MAPPIIDLTKDDQELATPTVVDPAGRSQSSGTKRGRDVEEQFRYTKKVKLIVPKPLPFDSPKIKPVKLIIPEPLADDIPSRPLLSLSDDSSDEDELILNPNNGDACPICEASVDAKLLAQCASNPSFETDVRLQLKFCRAHRTESAKQTWQDRGYPSIDWGETLDSRLRRHDGVVRSLLSNSGSAAEDSPFLREFSEKVRSGRERTFLSMVTLGYYGPRGTRHISEFLAREFHAEIVQWALDSWPVSARGKAAFLHSVVAPELAVRLVMEDMDVEEVEARSILEDSRDVGELLNDDYGDVVVGDSDDEDEGGGNLR